MSKTRYQNICNNYFQNPGLLRLKKKSALREDGHQLTAADVERIVLFITNYATNYAIALPGRHKSHKNFNQRLLPSSDTKHKVYRLYTEATENENEILREDGKEEHRIVCLSTFRKMWRTYLPDIKCCRPMTDLCATCHKNNYEVYRSNNFPECVKSAKLKKQEQHLELVKQERDFYNSLKEECKEKCVAENIHLGPSTAASKEGKQHFSFDFAQQLAYPNDPIQPGPVYFLAPRKCGLFGVHCEGLKKQVNYLIDEAHSTSKGSNAVISYLHHFFQNFSPGEKEVDLHCDNCSGQNKNSFMLWYLCLRTLHKLHHRVGLHFLLVGHTKFSPDWGFGLIKKKYTNTRVDTLADIARVVEESSPEAKVNIPLIVGREDGTVTVPTFNFQEHLKQFFRPLPHIKSYQHFEFSASDPGVVVCKAHHKAPEVRFQLLRKAYVYPRFDKMPLLQHPGLDAARQDYLFNRVREFVSEEVKDVTCPRPTKKIRL